MEYLLSNPLNGTMKRFQRTRKGHKRINWSGPNRNNMDTVRLGGSPRRAWRIRVVPKMRFKRVLSSPSRLWKKLKTGYVNMMLNLAKNQSANVFGGKRIPMGRQFPTGSYTSAEFDKRLVLEIYKSLVASRECT
ncbi:hypothetical protein DCAR_0312176 [Daucus carota subsp. sativus]|uniref:Uncharacterized protein n=2 Tax=Daucus carota subsp. sativus TaxID=79200 RepID=A0AAF0WNM2_DAUCS|nr:PREDICTED: uncharacterized protein LOC108212498 [Daucus carota subsp. sativus]WOG92899.1 hypothetical protein DCAR_0312176 [Daucus carota subsp. sativus]